MAVVEQVNKSFQESSKEDLDEKKKLKQIDYSLNHNSFGLYNKGILLPSFGECLEILIDSLRIIAPITSLLFAKKTDLGKNIYLNMLLETGIPSDIKDFITKISYSEREDELISHGFSPSILEIQQTYLDTILTEFETSEQLHEIAKILVSMNQLHDLALYDFLKVLRLFSSHSSENSHDKPLPVNILSLEPFFKEYYAIIHNFKATASLARALCALQSLKTDAVIGDQEKDLITHALTKIHTITAKILSPEFVQKILCMIHQNPEFEPETNEYDNNFIEIFTNKLQENYLIDTSKIKEKILENQFAGEVKALFGEKQIQEVGFYNKQNSNFLLQKKLPNFTYIRAMQLLKTFATIFLSEQKTEILKKLQIEGFFANTTERDTFSHILHNCLEIESAIAQFEKSLELGGESDFSLISQFLNTAKNDSDMANVKNKISTINTNAKNLLDAQIQNLDALLQLIITIYADAKLPRPATILNIKLLFSSTRNKARAEELEKSIPLWQNFIQTITAYTSDAQINSLNQTAISFEKG
ncbi:MAG: DUF5312 family protein [Treponemataceae bacterium]